MMNHVVAHGVLAALLIATLGCETPSGPATGSDPVDERIENPLRTYVEQNFIGTGGSNFGHIKIYGNLFRAELSDEEKVWLATHYDFVDHGSWDLAERAKQVNPRFLSSNHFNVAYNNRESVPSELEAWVESPDNVEGYTLDDLLINYQAVNQNKCGDFQSGDFLPQGKRCHWYTHDPKTEAWQTWAVDALITSMQLGTANQRDGVVFDDITFANDGVNWDYSEEYFGVDPSSPTHPRIAELYSSMGALYQAMDRRIPGDRIYIANIGSTYWLLADGMEGRKALAHLYAPNIQDETWIIENSFVQAPKAYDSHYQRTLVRPITDFMRRGHGYMFETGDYQNTDRGKRFTLTMFYLVNQPLAFYWYRHMGGSNAVLEDYMWNRYVEFDVGQPMRNQLGHLDFEGEVSNEHFLLAEEETYALLAREYTGALILVKLMNRDEPVGQNPTTHALPTSYRILQPDLSLSNPVTEVTLVNNDGVILVKD